MSVKRIYPTHRLRRFFGGGEGRRRSELLAAAHANLDSIHAASVVEIGTLIERIQELGAALRCEPDAAKAQQIYDLSDEICQIAGALGLVHLGEAAYSFCELLDQMASAKKWNWPAIQVHLDGIRILRAHGSDQEAVRDSIIDGLAKVVSRVEASIEKSPPPAARAGAEPRPRRKEP
jgi:hypothetical protein